MQYIAKIELIVLKYFQMPYHQGETGIDLRIVVITILVKFSSRVKSLIATKLKSCNKLECIPYLCIFNDLSGRIKLRLQNILLNTVKTPEIDPLLKYLYTVKCAHCFICIVKLWKSILLTPHHLPSGTTGY